MTIGKLLAKKNISRDLFRVCRLNRFSSRSEIESFFWEHGTFEGLQNCDPQHIQELEALIDASLIRVGLNWKIPKGLLRSRSLLSITDLLLKEQLLPEKKREVFFSSFRIYQDSFPLTPIDLAARMDLTERSVLRLRKMALDEILKQLPSLQGLEEDLQQNYELDLSSNLIIIDGAQAQRINHRAGSFFSPQFLGLLFGSYLEKKFSVIGRPEEVLAGNYLSISYLWSGFYLLRKELALGIDLEALLVECFRLKHDSKMQSLNFRTFVSHFIAATHKSELDLFLPVTAEILLRELGLRVTDEQLLFPPRRSFPLCEYTREALETLGEPSRQEVVRQKVEEMNPGIMVDRNRFDLVMLEKWGFTRYKNFFGLKKWFPEGSGKLKDQDPAFLEKLAEALPVRSGDYWKLHWDRMFSELISFTDFHGRLPVKEGPVEEKKLFNWLRLQTRKVRKGELDVQQLAKYEQFRVRFPIKWVVYNSKWDLRYAELKEFAQTHSRPPRKTVPGEEAALYKWLILQKVHNKKGKLNIRKKTLLRDFEELYPLRKPRIVRDADYQRLISFTEMFSRLPKQNAVEEEERTLNYFWLKQLEKMKQGKLVRHHEALLKNLKQKFPYDATHHKKVWHKRMEELKAFVEAQGLPTGHKLSGEAKTLRGWLIIQRVRLKKGELDSGQEELLKEFDELYVVRVDRKAEWEYRFLEVEDFAVTHSRLPKLEFVEERPLYRWLMTQRSLMNKDNLDQEQKKYLLDFLVRYPLKGEVYWKVFWYGKFEALEQFVHTHSRLPEGTVKEELCLYQWFKKEQLKGKKGKLDSIQRSRLQELVDRFPVVKKVEEHWQARVRELQEFIGVHSRLPRRNAPKEERSLHFWFEQQNRRRERGKLDQQKAILIKNLGNRYLRKKPEWEERFEEVKIFVETHLRIPKRTATDEEELALNHWFQGQKERLRKGRLGKWQAELVLDLVQRYGTGPGRSKPKAAEVVEEEE